MKIHTMRKIDFYVGVPLCFLVSIAKKLLSSFGHSPKIKPENILLIELSEMGSTILADPAMQKLKKKLKANLHFVIFKNNRPSLDLLKTIKPENIFCIKEDNLVNLTKDTLKFLSWCREKKIDTVIDLELFSRFSSLLSALSGAKNLVGFYSFHNEGLYRGNFLTHKVAYNPFIHIAKNFISLTTALISSNNEIPYSKTFIDDQEIELKKLEIKEQDKIMVKNIINKYRPDYNVNKYKIILINPNASQLLPQRRWPIRYYYKLIKKILATNNNILVLITGSETEKEEIESLKSAINHDRCLNFAGKLLLTQLPVLYSISHFMITNDSGPAHFAAVTNMPTYVFFGPETPALYGSLGQTTPIYAGLACSPCVSAFNHRATPCTNNVCLQVLTPEIVFEIIKDHLN